MPAATQSETITTQTTPRTAIQARIKSARLRAYAALALGVGCIAFSAIFTKWSNVPGPVSAFYRVAIATVALAIPYAIHLYSQRRAAAKARSHAGAGAAGEATQEHHSALRIPRSALAFTALAGLFFAGDLASWNTSLWFTSAANSTLMGNLSTIWVSLGALLIFHESLKRRFWAGMVIAVTGVVIVVGQDVFGQLHFGWGDLIAVGSSVFYASYLLTTGHTRRHMGTLPFMWLNTAAATVILLVFVLATGQTLLGFPPETWWSLLALGLISHALGWLSINYSLGHLPATLTAVTLLCQPVLTALLAVPLLNEALSPFQIVGGLIVLLGIYIVNSR
jgi:drug/metabolite transporter (DMT)-like permease